jgi:DNA invertase Pin-like site-specific DNA recombinase
MQVSCCRFGRPRAIGIEQLRELHEYCQRCGWTVAGEYVDIGISGTKEKRPELDRLLADAHRRRFDAVVVWRFDHFALRLASPAGT